MRVRMFMGITLALALALGATAARAASHRVIGRVTVVTNTSMEVRNNEETATIGVDAKTMYTKWVNHQPWQQDRSANSQSVAVGSCVNVELRADEGRVAKSVFVSRDGAGTLYDPCRDIR
jgi:hypothetical protein